mgnify:CR=1 FL=1
MRARVPPPVTAPEPSRIGEGQPGSTCSLSAVSGLPALSVPAGATMVAIRDSAIAGLSAKTGLQFLRL